MASEAAQRPEVRALGVGAVYQGEERVVGALGLGFPRHQTRGEAQAGQERAQQRSHLL